MRHRWKLAAAIAVMFGGCVDDDEPRLEDTESAVISGATNGSLGASATASSTYVGYAPGYAIDGSTATAWTSANTSCAFAKYSEDCPAREFLSPPWMIVTFPTTQTIDELAIRWNSPRRYEIQVCAPNVSCGADGSGWQVVPGGDAASSTVTSYKRLFFDVPVQASAVRVVIYESYGFAQRAQISELEAWRYPAAWTDGAYDCDAVCSANTAWSTECREPATQVHTTCGQYGVYSGSCASYCGGWVNRTCSSSCITPTGTTSTCGATGYTCVTDSMATSTPECRDVCTYQASYHHTYCKLTSSSNFVSTCGDYGVYAPAEVVTGAISTTGGADVNRCAPDVAAQFAAIPTNDRIGAISYDGDALHFSPSCNAHWQGIQRLTNDPTRFVMTASNQGYTGRFALGRIPDGGGIARLGAAQAVIQQLVLAATDHPGGMQALGNYVFVGVEVYEGFDQPAYIQEWNTASGGFVQVGGSYNLGPNGAAAVAMTKLDVITGEPGSRFLMMVPRRGDSSVLEFYLTPPGASLGQGLGTFYPAGSVDMRPNGIYANGWMGFQNVNFVTDCNGDLYLAAFANTSSQCKFYQPGDDWMKLYKISYRFDPITERLVTTRLDPPVVATHVYLSGQVNLAAASGLYVTGENKLQVIATEHAESSSYGSGIDVSELSAP
ncbi:MAG TPA: discoidin domain-containing protein [Kofleriaceae bacterium]|nr:discoidin domain-containing protein [Kofleriaceae bacterium]